MGGGTTPPAIFTILYHGEARGKLKACPARHSPVASKTDAHVHTWEAS